MNSILKNKSSPRVLEVVHEKRSSKSPRSQIRSSDSRASSGGKSSYLVPCDDNEEENLRFKHISKDRNDIVSFQIFLKT